MRPLVSRVNLWLFLSLGVLGAVQIYFIATSARLRLLREERIGRLGGYFLAESQRAYESGGPVELAQELQRLDSHFDTLGFLLDPQGRDLATGDNRAELVQRAEAQTGVQLPIRRPMFKVVAANRYQFVFAVPKGEREMVTGTGFLIGLLPILAVCYGYAALFALRLRRLERALEGFSGGDFSARAGPESHDAIGRVYRTFNIMAERIQALLSSERRLFMDLSHELRSPLTRLRVALKLARVGRDRDGALEQGQRECARLNDLITDLLQLAHAEVDPQARVAERVEPDVLIEELVGACAIEAAEQGCEILSQLTAVPALIGDPQMLRSAIENVLRNAIRHAPRGSSVEVSVRREDGNCVVTIRDRGPGVPPSALADIFRPFYRVHNDRRRETGGVGLGLAIAQRAVALHAGSIRAENAEPGLRVTLAIPEGRVCQG